VLFFSYVINLFGVWLQIETDWLTKKNTSLLIRNEYIFFHGHLMTGRPQGKQYFCFPETFNILPGFASDNNGRGGVSWKQKTLFAMGPFMCFVITPNLKKEQCKKYYLLHAGWLWFY